MNSEPAAVAGTKRSYSSSLARTEAPKKRRKVHRALRHVQHRPKGVEPAPQDPVFAQGQLLKSITAALVMAGFDSVKSSALEAFRAQVEEYMLRFLTHARTSMSGNRRTTPTALDFASALAHMPESSTASLLKPHLKLPIPEDISCPSIPEPASAPPSAPDFSSLLKPLIQKQPPAWIPKHFPALPPQHTWKQTPVFPERERDARKMREKATEEGMLAEQALRKLAAAHKMSAMNAERRRTSVLSGQGKSREPPRPRKAARSTDDTFSDLLKDLGGTDEGAETTMDETEAAKEGMDLGMPEGVMVNHDMSHWRRVGGQRRAGA